jgi:hypothetical protein
VMGQDGPVDDYLVVYLDSIEKRLLEDLTRMTGARPLGFPSLGDRASCTFYLILHQYRRGSFGP